MNKPHTPGARGRATQQGFTLIEMLIVMAVLVILMPMGISQLNGVLDSLKLTAASNGLVSHFHFARSEAIKRNGRVVLCKSADGRGCSSTGGWDQGWIVFDDTNGNGQREASETLLAREDRLPGVLRLTGNLNVARYVSFAPNGATKLSSGAFQAGTLTICRYSTEAAEARQVILNAVGRPRVQRAILPDCA
ncbi:MAG: GspH/FimT family pseudopilin [Ramlibacter sp.]|nr:GspH/FimT family pseudopilin [Ramlibacter sp.]